jgi:flagellar FliL protein
MSKPEAKEAPAAPAAETAQPAAAASGGGAKAWLPAIVAAVIAPAASFAIGQYVLLPKLQTQLAAIPSAEKGAAEHGAEPAAEPAAKAPAEAAHGAKGAKEAPAGANFEYANLVVNLAGTMGTRYLKTSLVITGAEKAGNVRTVFEGQKDKLKDLTINVLSSLTLADLEEPGSKNLLREKLVAAYNTVLGKRVVEQVYFSDFVVQ